MMRVYAAALLGASLHATGVAATSSDWLNAPSYSSPSNTNNTCNSQQQSGFDWSGLSPGSFSSYGGASFSGFSCLGGKSKRFQIVKKTSGGFQDKCIAGGVSKGSSGGPAMSCGQDMKGFSITKMHVTTDKDTDLECNFHMPDNSICKQTVPCSSGGTVINNDQCGGAKSVSFGIPKAGSGPSSCSMSIHSIGFDCSTASSTIPATSIPSSSALSTESIPLYTPVTTSAEVSPSTPVTSQGTSTPSVSVPSVSPLVSPSSFSPSTIASVTPLVSPSFSTGGVVSSPSPSTLVSFSPSVGFSASSSPESPSVQVTPSVGVTTSPTPLIPAYTPSPSSLLSASSPLGQVSTPSFAVTPTPLLSSTIGISSGVASSPVASPESLTTEIVYTTTTTCPAGQTVTHAGVPTVLPTASVSTILLTSTRTICTRCAESPTPQFSAGVSGSVALSLPSVNVPGTPSPYVSSPSALGTTSAAAAGTLSSAAPAPAASCPGVVPNCLNTWMWSSGCKDNTDYGCFCRNVAYAGNVCGCIQAFAADQAEMEQAHNYFLGICAQYLPSQPGLLMSCAAPKSSPSATTVPQIASSAPAAGTSPGVSGTPAAQGSPSVQGTSEAIGTPVAPFTSTIYSTFVATITSCAPSITNCPARGGTSAVVTTSQSVGVTIISTASVVPTAAASSGGAPAISSSPYVAGSPAPSAAPSPYVPGSPSAAGGAPAASQPSVAAGVPATSQPVTTVTISTTTVVPCTYSNGVSQGSPIPASSSTSTIQTTVTVPQVAFTTATITGPGGVPTSSVALGTGSPVPVSATVTGAAGGATGGAAGGAAPSYAPAPAASSPAASYAGGAGSSPAASYAGGVGSSAAPPYPTSASYAGGVGGGAAGTSGLYYPSASASFAPFRGEGARVRGGAEGVLGGLVVAMGAALMV